VIILLAVAIAVQVFIVVLMFRNTSVHAFRVKWLYKDIDTYWRLPSYEVMLFQFWRPLNSFLESEATNDLP
jgi:hypothetical protein